MYYRPLFRYIAFRVSDPLTAEDLTSEVFTRLLDALHRGKAPRSTLRGWLFGVAARVVSDYHRNRYRAQEVELVESLANGNAGLLETVEETLTREQLAGALKELTGEQQTVLALRFGAGLPIREVAGMMGKSEGAVKQLQARAIAALSRRMNAGGER